MRIGRCSVRSVRFTFHTARMPFVEVLANFQDSSARLSTLVLVGGMPRG